jgi:cation:H+ antiporter
VIHDLIFFVVGLTSLVAGAYILVEGGTRIASVFGIPPVVVGLTIVAFGTSAPELFVSALGAFHGNTGLVLGNVVGSNVANIGLILGTAAVIRPVIVEKGLARFEVRLLMAATAALAFFVWDGTLGRIDALLLVLGFAVFMLWTLKFRENSSVPQISADELPDVEGHRVQAIVLGLLMVVTGIILLAWGGSRIVTSAMNLARMMNVSETLIGLTLVAVGTSLPELATTIVAAVRNQDDMALGNIVGSNLFNILAVAGPVGVFWRLDVENNGNGLALGSANIPGHQVQLMSMVILTIIVALMIVVLGGKIGRLRGVVLLGSYGAITALWMMI